MMTEVFPWREASRADYAVIGDPVSHSLSPRMHMAAYRSLGLDLHYVAVHVPPGEVAEALDHLADLGYAGANVTVPHKEEVLAWASKVDPFAARVRAGNTVRFGDRSIINTDGPGLLETLHGVGKRSGERVLLLGAGGSARAIAQALVDAGFEVAIFNRTAARAEELAAAVGAEAVERPDLRRAFLILNATSASLSGGGLDLDWSEAGPSALAYDLMYSVGPTPFLQAAQQMGLETLDGRELLVAQGALAFEYWLGRPAPRAVMREAIQ